MRQKGCSFPHGDRSAHGTLLISEPKRSFLSSSASETCLDGAQPRTVARAEPARAVDSLAVSDRLLYEARVTALVALETSICRRIIKIYIRAVTKYRPAPRRARKILQAATIATTKIAKHTDFCHEPVPNGQKTLCAASFIYQLPKYPSPDRMRKYCHVLAPGQLQSCSSCAGKDVSC